jgi:hypothetical protein
MTSKKSKMLKRVSAHASKPNVGRIMLWSPANRENPEAAHVCNKETENTSFGPDWTPTVLEGMGVGQSFSLPGHLVKLWTETAAKLRARVPECADWKFAFRTVDELNSRMWRVK